ncbi:MAG: hypothetical protein Q8R28_09015, partial [Dehalococcoidia bacterium]|nr:hypothetical protein [Dehalococcoidia bacterium]
MPKQVEAVGSPQYPDAVEHLVKYLSSPRLHPRGTIIAYRQTALHFLRGRDDHLPAADDFRDYFIARRKTGISERSLHLDFYALKMLAKANKWDWPFDSRDAPIS